MPVLLRSAIGPAHAAHAGHVVDEALPDVFFNGRFLVRRPTGVDRFAREIVIALDELLAALPERRRGRRFTVLVPDQAPVVPMPALHCLRIVRRGGRAGQAWEQGPLAWVSRGGLLVNLCNTGPVARRAQLVVLHDAATARMPQSFSIGFRRWYGVLMPWLGRVSRRVVTVSRFSRAELSSAFGVPPGKIGLVGEGAEHVLRVAPDPTVLARHDLQRRPYFLAVGSPAPHKNFAVLLAALRGRANAGFDLAIAGAVDRRVFAAGGGAEAARVSGDGSDGSRDAAAASAPAVRWLGAVDDTELRALYMHAAGFLFPSRYEGFGLPPIEAMACGCPVVVARAAAMPEVCGDAALYVDPGDADGWFAAMVRLRDEPALAARLRQAGVARATGHTWAASADALLDEIDRASHGLGRPGRAGMGPSG